MVKVGLICPFLKMHSVIIKQSFWFLYLLGPLVLTFYLIIVKPLDLKRRPGYEFHKKTKQLSRYLFIQAYNSNWQPWHFKDLRGLTLAFIVLNCSVQNKMPMLETYLLNCWELGVRGPSLQVILSRLTIPCLQGITLCKVWTARSTQIIVRPLAYMNNPKIGIHPPMCNERILHYITDTLLSLEYLCELFLKLGSYFE